MTQPNDPTSIGVNLYGGYCDLCGEYLLPGEGSAERINTRLVLHHQFECPEDTKETLNDIPS